MQKKMAHHLNDKTLRMSSYRLSYWHAPKRARHDEWEILDCVICRYTEGVALMDDIVGYLRRLGFPITNFDERTFTLDLTPRHSTSGLKTHNTKDALFQPLSGTPLLHH